MDKHYLNEIGTEIIINCGSDVSTASKVEIRVLKPNGEAVWIPDKIEKEKVSYITKQGDLDASGFYYIQVYVEQDNWKGLGETATLRIYDKWE